MPFLARSTAFPKGAGAIISIASTAVFLSAFFLQEKITCVKDLCPTTPLLLEWGGGAIPLIVS